MCEHCDNSFIKNVDNDYIIHKPLYTRNSNNWKRIKADGTGPMMYLKEYLPNGDHIWSLVCEINDDNKTIVETPIIYCPRCGDKLVGRKS